MKAVQFGAGSIGRGFIADLLHDSGYEIVFVDINEQLIQQINRHHSYLLYLINDNYKIKEIDQVSAVSSIRDREQAIREIDQADIITTSVWADNLGKVAPVILEGLKERYKNKREKINVLACENAVNNSEMLRQEILKLDPDFEENLEQVAAFPNTAVDRMVLEAHRDGEDVIDIGSDYELVIEQNKLADSKTHPIKGAVYTDNLMKYIERKLYIINCGHAWAGYMGFLNGYEIIQDVFHNEHLVSFVRETMLESGRLIMEKYNFTKDEIENYIDFAINRFQTPGITDTISRVSRSPIRKLQAEERFVGPATQCEERGLTNDRLLQGIASIFLYDTAEDPQSIELKKYIKDNGIEQSIEHFTGISRGTRIFEKILKEYDKLTKIDRFLNAEGITIVEHVINEIKRNRDYLSEVDGMVGDGDHGINMNKGFTFAAEEIAQMPDCNMSEGFMVISNILVNKIGGSMGPLYGNFFRGLSTASRKSDMINKEVMLAMLTKAYSNILSLTEAKVGDKTLIDVLDPAVDSYKKSVESGRNFLDCLDALVKAAKAGLESTKHMVAKLGRASRLGERAIGHQDAGATSCFIILKAIRDAVYQLTQQEEIVCKDL